MKILLNIIQDLLTSFLWRSESKQTRGKRIPRPSLQVKVHRQWTSYSCTAAVAQMISHYYGVKMSHREAIRITKCNPDGAELSKVAKALKRHHGLRPQRLTRPGL